MPSASLVNDPVSSRDSRTSALLLFGLLSITLCTPVVAAETLLLCKYNSDVYPVATPDLEVRFDESGVIRYGTRQQVVPGSVSERAIVFWLEGKPNSSWVIDRMSGEMSFFVKAADKTEQDKAIRLANCKSIAERKF